MKTYIKHFCAMPARWLAALALVVFTLTARAEDAKDTNAPAAVMAPRRMENRFLFIIDVSASMSHSTNTVFKAVLGLLQSDLGGQLREGDTIGVWTFADKVHLNEKDKKHPMFPMQIWHLDEKNDIMRRVSNFLRFQTYDKKSDLKKVLPEFYTRVSASQTLTAIIVSDGSNPISGTPFDDDINDLQKRFGAEFRAANLPLVTVLATREGEVFDYTVNSGADTIRIPQTAAPFVPKIVVLPPPPAPAPEPKHIEIVVSPQTNSVTGRGVLTNKPAPVVVAPVVTPPPVVVPTPAPAPTPAPVVKPTEANFGPDVSPGVAQVIKLMAKGVGEEPLLAYVDAYPKPFNPSVDEILLMKDSGIPDTVVAAIRRHMVEPTKTTPAPAPAPVVQQEAPKPEVQPAPAPVVAVPPATKAQPAMVVVSNNNPLMLVMAFSLLAIAIVLIIFLLRRPKAVQPSLISQSINRKD